MMNTRANANLAAILVAITLIPSMAALGPVIRFDNDVYATPASPIQLSGGPCFEDIQFYSGFAFNRFQVISTFQGHNLQLTINIKLDNGVGVISGLSGLTYRASVNEEYTQSGSLDQHVFPHELYFRITRSDGQEMTVKKLLVVLLDPVTGTVLSVLVDSYEVVCS